MLLRSGLGDHLPALAREQADPVADLSEIRLHGLGDVAVRRRRRVVHRHLEPAGKPRFG